MNDKKVPLTVIDILKWKNDIGNENWPLSVEDFNETYTNKCGGKEMTDVLFSFLGIYAVGIWAYNKDNKGLFKIEKNKIKVSVEKNGIYSKILCSKKFLLQLQKENVANIDVYRLNESIKDFVDLYFDVGNLIPMWPGGNTLKGNQNKGFMDIPELFFTRYYNWYQVLERRENAHLQEMTQYLEDNQTHFESLESFLNSVNSVEKYNQYINHVVAVIKARTENIIKL